MTEPTKPPRGTAKPRPTVMSVFSRRLLSHSSVYAFTSGLGVFWILTQIVILTRLLEPGVYGDLALLLLYSGFVALVAGLGVAQGTVISAFVGGDEEGFGDETTRKRPVTDNRGVLMTGLLVTVINGLLLTALSALAGGPLARLLTGDADANEAVIFATLYGGLAPAWRLVGAIPRFERRPAHYLAMQTGNHGVSILCASWFAYAGYGIAGVGAGLALGRVVAIAIGLFFGRHRFRRTFKRAHAKLVFANGWPYAGVVLAFFISRNAEMFVLSHYVRGSEVGVYQVSSRLSMIPSFALSATLMAWGPLMRGPIRAALEKAKRLGAARDRLITYFLMLSTWTVVAATLIGDIMVRLAPSEYASAAKMLPLLTLATTLHAGTMLIFRMSAIKGGLRRLRRWALISVPLLVGGAFLVVPYHGAIGAAAVNAAVPAIGLAVLYISSKQGKDPIQLSIRQVAGIAVIAIACVAGGRLAGNLPRDAHLAVELGLVVGFPLLLLITGVFPRSEARQLLRLVRPSVAGRPLRAGDLRARLGELTTPEVELLEALVRHKQGPAAVAARIEVSETELCERMIALVRRVSETGEPGKDDAEIGRTLLTSTAQTKRDLRAYQLTHSTDVDPLELDRLAQALHKLGRLRPRAWAAARAASRPAPESEPAPAL